MKAIIVGPGKDGSYTGQGVYTLVAEDGECLCSHLCSASYFAPGDLYEHRPERKEMFDAKGITEFVWLAESGIPLDERGGRGRMSQRALAGCEQPTDGGRPSLFPLGRRSCL